MKQTKLKSIVEAANELGTSYREMIDALKGFSKETDHTKHLWRIHNESKLIKIGLALIAFPDPTISDIIGSAFIAAGLIKTKMKKSTLYLEDLYKTFPDVIDNLENIRKDLSQ